MYTIILKDGERIYPETFNNEENSPELMIYDNPYDADKNAKTIERENKGIKTRVISLSETRIFPFKKGNNF